MYGEQDMLTNNPTRYALLLDKIYQGQTVECPNCGSEKLQHRFHAKNQMGFAWFECPDCDMKAHLSRVKFPKHVKTEKM